MREFNPKMHAKSMKEQASEIIPNDISQESKDYILEILHNYTLLAGDHLAHENESEVSDEQCFMISQIVAEWTFHKCVDLAHSKIPREYWDSIMQEISFIVFEDAKIGVLEHKEQQIFLENIEKNVNKTWNEKIEELLQDNKITEVVATSSKYLSNIDDYSNNNECMEDTDETKFNRNYDEHIKNVRFNKNIIILIGIITIGFMFFVKPIIGLSLTLLFITAFIVYFIKCKVEMNKREKDLEIARQELRDIVNPDKMYDRLGCDTLSVTIDETLIELADIDKEGQLLARVAALRQQLTDEYGLIIPEIRIMDALFGDNQYVISVRNNIVAKGTIYPSKFQIIEEECIKNNIKIPENAIAEISEPDKKQVYWIDKKDKENLPVGFNCHSEYEVFISHLKYEILQNVDKVFTINNVLKLIEYVKSKNQFLVDSLNSAQITEFHLKIILIELLKNRISIKDIEYIFEKICEVAQRTNEPNVIVEEIKKVLIKN